jgi:response regulator RpfG family c-di-GMP phosphodiesterase
MSRMIVTPDAPTEVLPLLHAHSVLCVDDEPAVLAALRRSLRGEPYDVLATESPGTALEFVGTREISLVISDHRMPEMSGLEMLQAIHECSPATTGVILTGYPESLSFAGRIGPVVRWVLFKPWDDDTLARLLRHLLRERELGRARLDGGRSGVTG